MQDTPFLRIFINWSLFWSLFYHGVLKALNLQYFLGHFSGFKSHLPQSGQRAESVDFSGFSVLFLFVNGMRFWSLWKSKSDFKSQSDHSGRLCLCMYSQYLILFNGIFIKNIPIITQIYQFFIGI